FEIAREYTILNLPAEAQGTNPEEHVGSGKLLVSGCNIAYPNNAASLSPDDKLQINLELKATETVKNPIIGVTVQDLAGREILVTNTKELGIKTGVFTKGKTARCSFTIDNIFNDGTYTIVPGIMDADMNELYDSQED